ncbi:MAG: type II toxin-antitoxin system VapC family toxin [Gemmataceae bacterium]|nr:type II toxin-antitoxin system VapC family toxin [Gemmataceae bacterium]
MRFFYLDASALVKRYAPEAGSLLVNHLFAKAPADRLLVFNVGMAEVVSILVRKHNGGHLSAVALAQAVADLGTEIIHAAAVVKVAADDALVVSAIPLIRVYSINSTDALILRSALLIATNVRTAGNDLVLVTSDKRLLKAAQAAGLTTFDPETQTQADLDALLAP